MIRLIVNADDYGMDENRTMAILESYRIGAITATTAMVNMPWFERAVEMAKGTGLYANIGLHLCLTEGRPLTEPIKQFPLFCNADGRFNANFHRQNLKGRLWLPTRIRAAVAVEVRAQMEKFLASGLPLRHLDSHHHSHTDWSVTPIIATLAKELGFMSIRRSRDLCAMPFGKGIYKQILNAYMERAVGFSTDGFGTVGDVLSRVDQNRDGVFEVMTHPLYRNQEELSMGGRLMDGLHGILTMQEIAEGWKKHADWCECSGYEGVRR